MSRQYIGEEVVIKISGERGVVSGVAFYDHSNQAHYQIQYKAADGRAVTDWFWQKEVLFDME